MSNNVVFMLDNDKVFLELYSKLLQTKGWQVFATDNLFLLTKYAKTAQPEWIFIDQNFANHHEKEIVKIIDKAIDFKRPHYAIMSNHITSKYMKKQDNIEFVYKPYILEKIIQISENSCNPH